MIHVTPDPAATVARPGAVKRSGRGRIGTRRRCVGGFSMTAKRPGNGRGQAWARFHVNHALYLFWTFNNDNCEWHKYILPNLHSQRNHGLDRKGVLPNNKTFKM